MQVKFTLRESMARVIGIALAVLIGASALRAQSPATTQGSSSQPAVVDFRAADFGAKADDGKDQTASLQAAIDAASKVRGGRVVLEKGRYEVGGREVMPGRRVGVVIGKAEHLVIEGRGATLVGRGLTSLVVAMGAHDLTLRNLNVDWADLPFSGGKVVGVGEDFIDVQVSAPHAAEAGKTVQAVFEYDPDRHCLAAHGFERYQLGATRLTEVQREGVMRVFTDKPDARAMGRTINIRYQVYGYNAFTLRECEDVKIEGVTIYAAPGMGIYCERCRNVSLDNANVRILPGSGRWMSTCADATHFNSCRGLVALSDCTFEGMGDDATNIHTGHTIVSARLDDRTFAVKAGRPKNAPVLPAAGDVLEVGHQPNPLLPYATLTVESAASDPGDRLIGIVHAAGALPEGFAAGDLVGDASTCASVRIRNCRVMRNRARGFLLQSRDVLVEDCRFSDISGAGIHVCCDANHWYEGLGARDVTIRRCTFERCNFGAASAAATIDVFADPVGERIHHDIHIESNDIHAGERSAIHLGCTDGATITGNTIDGATAAAILIDHSRAVHITGNAVKNAPENVKVGDNCEEIRQD